MPRRSRTHQRRSPCSVVDRDGEHPAQTFDACDAPRRIRVQQSLGVAGGSPAHIAKRLADFHMVIDFTVQHAPVARLRIVHWLVPGMAEIENCQAGVSDHNWAGPGANHFRTLVIGAPVAHPASPCALQRSCIIELCSFATAHACYSAHFAPSRRSNCRAASSVLPNRSAVKLLPKTVRTQHFPSARCVAAGR